ncbi:hypothetical protein NPIL_255801 [Nephila pilipes]|uniref:Uncharacterized protein n=1 Tax=Nephila pilipes TaxID=299642 RepID=A0A8X6PXZ7_NEPPI|nr:hypothetical protein NPIL_255801 [Nephila pilipes]
MGHDYLQARLYCIGLAPDEIYSLYRTSYMGYLQYCLKLDNLPADISPCYWKSRRRMGEQPRESVELPTGRKFGAESALISINQSSPKATEFADVSTPEMMDGEVTLLIKTEKLTALRVVFLNFFGVSAEQVVFPSCGKVDYLSLNWVSEN